MLAIRCFPPCLGPQVQCNEDGVAADDLYVERSGNESQFYKFCKDLDTPPFTWNPNL